MKNTIIALVLGLLVTSCGGGGSGSTPVITGTNNAIVLTGQFIDSAVSGIRYETATLSGVTNSLGEFEYHPGDKITFSIGDIKLNSVGAASFITPLDLFNTSDVNNVDVVNFSRLLQSLDSDGNTANGISISDSTHTLAFGMQIDFADPDFDNMVASFVANSAAQNGGSAKNTLISSTVAIDHLNMSLINFDVASSCKSTHPKVGFSGVLSRLAHSVSGRVTVIDDCTILVTEFNYDGGGPLVYFYAGSNGNYNPINSNSFRISKTITGTRSSNAQITLKIPTGKSLNDFDGISVWCEGIAASFGDTILAKEN